MEPVELTFITKKDCHLCESAHAVVARVREAAQGRIELDYREIDIADDPEAAQKYAEYLPVILVDGRQHANFTVREDKLAAAITEAYRERKKNGGQKKQPGWLTRVVRGQ